MSFIQNSVGNTFNAGYFLAHEECVRVTYEIPQSLATTEANGTKYVKMGTLFEVSNEPVGFVYEDTDVTSGNMPGSIVTKGVVIEGRLPDTLSSADKEALEAKGFTFVSDPEVTRPY